MQGLEIMGGIANMQIKEKSFEKSFGQSFDFCHSGFSAMDPVSDPLFMDNHHP